MKKFSIGGWYEKFDQLFSFLNYYYSHREYFYPDREIDSFQWKLFKQYLKETNK